MKFRKGLLLWMFALIAFCSGCGNEGGDDADWEERTTEEVVRENPAIDNSIQVSIVPNEGEELPIEGNCEVHFIDVGQADATLVLCDGEAMLIDGGNVDDSSLMYSYLKEHDVEVLEYVICTHVHEDHVGGLAGALNYAKADHAFCPTKSDESEAFQDFVKYLAAQGKEIEVPKIGTEFLVGNAKCKILALNTTNADPNGTSIVIRLEYGRTSFLFCGDIEQEEEISIVESGQDLSCTVLKIPHHGSDLSLSDRLLHEAQPEYGVISAGEDNQYGHPAVCTIDKLRDQKVKLYRTDMQGHIVCTSDGKMVTFDVEKNADADTLVNLLPVVPDNTVIDDNRVIATEEDNHWHYILNTNTKKIHYPSCRSVKQMKEKNKKETDLSVDELMLQGYVPCKNCNP